MLYILSLLESRRRQGQGSFHGDDLSLPSSDYLPTHSYATFKYLYVPAQGSPNRFLYSPFGMVHELCPWHLVLYLTHQNHSMWKQNMFPTYLLRACCAELDAVQAWLLIFPVLGQVMASPLPNAASLMLIDFPVGHSILNDKILINYFILFGNK